MRCPKCGCDNDKVIDSRSFGDGSGVRRRRECSGCAYRFTTLEEIVPEELKVVKRNGVREEYRSEKLRTGIKNACYKRPVSDEEIDRIVEDINHSLLRDFDKAQNQNTLQRYQARFDRRLPYNIRRFR